MWDRFDDTLYHDEDCRMDATHTPSSQCDIVKILARTSPVWRIIGLAEGSKF